MPAPAARLRTASSRGSGRRRLTDLFLRLSSNRIGVMSEKSYCARSALATTASAWASVLNSGNFFFMGFDLLPMHEAGADGPDQRPSILRSKREHDEQAPAL